MVCTTVNVVAAKPTISAVAAVDKGNQTVRITWNQDVSGLVRVLNDGTNVQQAYYPAGANYLEISIAYGTHNICVEAV